MDGCDKEPGGGGRDGYFEVLCQTPVASQPGERSFATNDMAIFAVGLASSFGAGALLDLVGWQEMNLMLLPWLAVAAGVLCWQEMRGRCALEPVEA